MKIIDANILLYAVNEDAPQHAQVKAWWEAAINDNEPLGLPWVVLLAFLRISTNPRAFADPLPTATALEIVDNWLQCPGVHIVALSQKPASIGRRYEISSEVLAYPATFPRMLISRRWRLHTAPRSSHVTAIFHVFRNSNGKTQSRAARRYPRIRKSEMSGRASPEHVRNLLVLADADLRPRVAAVA